VRTVRLPDTDEIVTRRAPEEPVPLAPEPAVPAAVPTGATGPGHDTVKAGEPAPPGPFGGGTGAHVPHSTSQRSVRLRSRNPDDFAVPTGREEEWRFTPVRKLRGLLAGPEPDGKVSVEVAAPAEIVTTTVGTDDPAVGRALAPLDRLSALAFVRSGQATVVRVPAEARLAEPATVSLHGTGGTAYGHLVVDAGPFSHATVVLDHTGTASFADNVELVVGDSADLTVVSLQDWDDDAVHVGAHAVRVGRDARLRHIAVTLGGSLVRLSPTVSFAGAGGDVTLLGLFFTDRGQHHEHRLLVEHEARSCRSRVTYKGALQGEGAHSVWIGDVVIAKQAVGTDTYELNRNLVLGDGARADSVPNLEIETAEVVGAGHASATGRFDDEALFYLMSRGIPPQEARRLVVRGFFADVLGGIEVPALRERVLAAVEKELAQVSA
jgi:Fe-S cluster assembly protein SufD